MDINNITYTEPIDICMSDACEQGIGGFNISDLSWRYSLSEEMIGKLSINLLDFLASIITIYLTIVGTNYPQKVLT